MGTEVNLLQRMRRQHNILSVSARMRPFPNPVYELAVHGLTGYSPLVGGVGYAEYFVSVPT